VVWADGWHTVACVLCSFVNELDACGHSLIFAIRMTYRISLRSSSLWEPCHVWLATG
jgi:hypothetical protein